MIFHLFQHLSYYTFQRFFADWIKKKETDFKQTVTSEEPKGKRSDDVVQLKFSKGKRAEAKAFYSTYDVKMNAGFEMAYEFLKEEVKAGRVKISKSGIQRIS